MSTPNPSTPAGATSGATSGATAATAAIARFVHEFDLATAGPELRGRARALLLDFCSVTLAALDHDIVPGLLAGIDGAPAGAATLAGHGRASAPDAAFFNGALAHTLEYDDSTLNPVGHPGTVILPAVLALGEARGASGAEVLAAWLVGLEVHSRLGQAQRGNWSFTGGWLPIGHISLIGAAMGCARLLRLDPARVAHALGLAAHLCGQLSINAGSQAKPVGAGHAARSALIAARLAAAGLHGADQVIERSGGFADTFFGVGAHDLAPLARLGAPHHLEEIGVAIKRYPSCYGAHWGVDALLDLVARHALTPDNVAAIELAHPAAAAFLDDSAPTNEEEAKFSHEYNLAVALLRGIPRVRDFGQATLDDPALRAVLRRVRTSVHPADADSATARAYRVTVHTTDGRVLRHEVPRPLGHPRRPMSAADLDDKFRHCVATCLSTEAADALRDRVESLENLTTLGPLMTLLGAARRHGAAR